MVKSKLIKFYTRYDYCYVDPTVFEDDKIVKDSDVIHNEQFYYMSGNQSEQLYNQKYEDVYTPYIQEFQRSFYESLNHAEVNSDNQDSSSDTVISESQEEIV